MQANQFILNYKNISSTQILQTIPCKSLLSIMKIKSQQSDFNVNHYYELRKFAQGCCKTVVSTFYIRSKQTKTKLPVHNVKVLLCSAARCSFSFLTAFAVAGANRWNDLPFHVTSAQSLAVFKQRLKTFLFSRSYPDILIWLASLLLFIVIVFFFSGISCGCCNNWHYSGHVKHVDDNGDDKAMNT